MLCFFLLLSPSVHCKQGQDCSNTRNTCKSLWKLPLPLVNILSRWILLQTCADHKWLLPWETSLIQTWCCCCCWWGQWRCCQRSGQCGNVDVCPLTEHSLHWLWRHNACQAGWGQLAQCLHITESLSQYKFCVWWRWPWMMSFYCLAWVWSVVRSLPRKTFLENICICISIFRSKNNSILSCLKGTFPCYLSIVIAICC